MATSGLPRLRVSVLGPVRAWLGEREINLGPARQRAVFAALAVAANRPVSSTDLIDEVWGATPPATAVGSVYTYISGLRRGLDADRSGDTDGILTSGPSGYRLRLTDGELDSDRFRQLCARATDLRGAGDLTGAAATLDEALRLWRGDAYAGLPGHHFELRRTQLGQRRLAAVEQRARIMMELGDDGLVAELASLIGDHPLHEPLHELLMVALHRAGRQTEAVEAFRAARRVLATELGVEPGPGLRELHRRLLGGPAEPAPTVPLTAPIVPAPVAEAIRDGLATRPLVGRSAELARLRGLLRAVAGGTGAAVWIEGEPGIGKTELLTAAFAAATTLGCQLAWGVADRLNARVLPQVVRRLGAGPSPGNRVDVAAEPPGHAAEREVAADRLLAYVRSVCAVTPLVLVVDNLQWADDASVLLWERLVIATRRLPLLLVATARPEHNGRELARLRRGLHARQGHVLTLRGLSPAAIEELVTGLVGPPIGPNLARVVPLAGGNPLYARELTTELLRRGAVRVSGGRADIDASVSVGAPKTLLATIRSTLDFLTDGAQEVLRLAALLGTEFAADDVAAVTGRSPFDLMANLEEALSANVVVDAGTNLAFRHPFLRQALYESIPAAVRAALHRHTAEVLDHGGSPVTRVAEQLAAARPVIDAWVVDWLVTHHAEVVERAPSSAGELLRHVLATDLPSRSQRAALLVALVKLDYRHERYPMEEAREALELAAEPAVRAKMRHLLATMRYRRGDPAGAIELLTDAVDDPAVPQRWRTRHWVLLAKFRRGDLDDLDRADHAAQKVYDEAVAAGQPREAAFALQTRWLTNSIRRDHERALDYVDRALDAVRDHPSFIDMRFDLLDNRMFTLQNLDRLDEAERTRRTGALLAIRHRLPANLRVASAVQRYWLGRWDDAMIEVNSVTGDVPDPTHLGIREPFAVTILLHGVVALIAGHRDDPDLAAAYLDRADTLPATDAEREGCDFLLIARALASERHGRGGDAVEQLAPLLTPEYAPLTPRHQWLPQVLRLAREAGRDDIARRALRIALDEAAKEARPARAWAAAARCRALAATDPGPALDAAAHYRRVGRVPELAAALEDAAVLLAAGRRPHDAARYGGEAAAIYTVLGARWDLRRTRRRLAEFGVDSADAPLPTVGAGHSGVLSGAR
ncbi:BTAD domain-containing putative transcriptional regulator [Rhizomonospora bruguierae]|uniref:BTAD domain-containing putative transcriptional regulator n=1 Tax=Rhizomonospora bruguierae TaxID=1581705 RepID=UPI001BD13292|nr:BTAD domain-containing putative transcriptional regulator [Micromonospora sp. NBRC 107566]